MTLNLDRPNYTAPDSGCYPATDLLGHQSHCLSDCPFKRCCIYDMGVLARHHIIGRLKFLQAGNITSKRRGRV